MNGNEFIYTVISCGRFFFFPVYRVSHGDQPFLAYLRKYLTVLIGDLLLVQLRPRSKQQFFSVRFPFVSDARKILQDSLLAYFFNNRTPTKSTSPPFAGRTPLPLATARPRFIPRRAVNAHRLRDEAIGCCRRSGCGTDLYDRRMVVCDVISRSAVSVR